MSRMVRPVNTTFTLTSLVTCAGSLLSKNCCYTFSLKLWNPLAPSDDVIGVFLCNWASYIVPLYWRHYVGETFDLPCAASCCIMLDQEVWA